MVYKGTRRTNKKHTSKTRIKKRTNKKRTNKTSKSKKGGNYEKDFTTSELNGVSLKQLNNVIVTTPGLVLSGAAYKKLMENRDMYGTEQY